MWDKHSIKNTGLREDDEIEQKTTAEVKTAELISKPIVVSSKIMKMKFMSNLASKVPTFKESI